MNDLIKRTENLISKLSKAVAKESKDSIKMDEKYSNFIGFLLAELRNYVRVLEEYQQFNLPNVDYSSLNVAFFAKMSKYIKEREFSPLMRTSEFKDLFANFNGDTDDAVVNFVNNNMTSLLKFSVLSNQVLTTNKIFADDILYAFDYNWSEEKRYHRACPVTTKLEEIKVDGMSSLALVETYKDGAFDKLCKKALKDKERCDALRANNQSGLKRNRGLKGLFYGLF